MKERSSVIVELLDEIRQMEDTVVYFEGRILKKRIAIAELMTRVEPLEEPVQIPAPPTPHLTRTFKPRPRSRQPWWTAVDRYLEGINGSTFVRADLMREILIAEPGSQKSSIRNWLSSALERLETDKRITRTAAGYQKA